MILKKKKIEIILPKITSRYLLIHNKITVYIGNVLIKHFNLIPILITLVKKN